MCSGLQDTALHLAAKNGHEQVVNHLLSQKQQFVSYNSCNQNALDIAIEAGKDGVVKTIAEHQRFGMHGATRLER